MPTSADGTIIVEHVWKRFRSDRGRPNLRDQVAKIGRRLRGGGRDYRWVLKDINFELEPGGTMALIGINGSGKSTMLKVISRCMYQTAGRCETYGRIGALLEVRGGINPILSGRENIYMFGSLLGLSRRDINARFDTIAEFAEVTDAIDRQVKYYSSGMQVRLGFSIASHLDADILLVDEILAVGDANFQQKCLSRISEVVANGTTLLFVSHDLAAVEAMCERAIWLTEATTRASGPTAAVLGQYRGAIEEHAATASDGSSLRVLKVEVIGPDGGMARSGEDVMIRLALSAPEGGAARFFIGVSEGTAVPVFVARRLATFPEGDFEVKCALQNLPLPRGHYYVWLAVEWTGNKRPAQPWKPVGSFDVFGPTRVAPPKGVMVLSPVLVPATWEFS
ncbi:MAG TPA: ABC transporter ATP-binding protein [Acidimicrobiales bacterium]|nr:ABC transporter ATP-binding protein [Acidimicrobiales bacterium]